jgi:ubiquinone/menaquinone biosynthesis C-methylase UbiE
MSIDSSTEPAAFRQFEHGGWEEISNEYEKYFANLTSQCARLTLDAAGVGSGMSMLDVCTGPGVLAAAGIARKAHVTGLDFSKQAVSIARKNVPRADFDVGDAQSLPYENNSFDAVVSGFGVIHAPDPALALSEIGRVLKPQGRMAISVWEAPRPGNGFGLIFGAIKSHGDLSVSLPHGPDFFQFSENDKMTSALQDTAFENVTVQTVEQTWEPENASELIEWIMQGSVRARGLLQIQSESRRSAIFGAIKDGISQFDNDGSRYKIPMPAIVGSGDKPRNFTELEL